MTFITHQNHRLFFWLRWAVFLFFVFIFFILGGSSIVVRGAMAIRDIFSFSKNISTPEQIAVLQAKIADLEQEREHLSTLLGNKEESKKIIPANVSLSGGYLFADSIVVDRGTNDGVSAGDYITTKDGIFVGNIVELGPNWSRVIPFTQLGRKTVVRGGANKDMVFEISGIGGGEATADLPVSAEIKIGDIFWSGEHQNFIIGIIDRADQSSASQIQTVYFKPPIAFKFLTLVNIHKKNI